MRKKLKSKFLGIEIEKEKFIIISKIFFIILITLSLSQLVVIFVIPLVRSILNQFLLLGDLYKVLSPTAKFFGGFLFLFIYYKIFIYLVMGIMEFIKLVGKIKFK